MGVICSLVAIDHTSSIERGGPLVDEALRTGDWESVRRLIRELPLDDTRELAAVRRERERKLRELGAPSILVENEARQAELLEDPRGFACAADPDGLRSVLGGWNSWRWQFRLDKSFEELAFFFEPHRRDPRRLAALRAYVKRTIRLADVPDEFLDDAPRSPLGLAIFGRDPYPQDGSGTPRIDCGGDPENSRYNPPDLVRELARAVAAVDPASWDEVLRLAAEDPADPGRLAYEEGRRNLEFAREALPIVVRAYALAAERGFGIACSFVL